MSDSRAQPLSFAPTDEQREIWLAAQVDDGAHRAFNAAVSIRLRGNLGEHELLQAIKRLIQRHDALRMTFSVDGVELRIANDAIPALRTIDLTGVEAAGQETKLAAIKEEEDRMLFDLVRGPLVRFTLVRLSVTEHVLIFAWHHLAVDGWSAGVLIRELHELCAAARSGRESTLEPAMQFRDFAAWKNEPEQLAARIADEEFWFNQYVNAPPQFELPTDRPRGARASYSSAHLVERLDEAHGRDCKPAARRLGCTEFHFFLGAFVAWSSRTFAQPEVAVAIPCAGQLSAGIRARPGSRRLVGHCASFLPVRFHCDEKLTVREHMLSVKERLRESMAHQNVRYGSLAHRLRLPRDPARNPLVSVSFNYLPFAEQRFTADGLDSYVVLNGKSANFLDCNIHITTGIDGLASICEYNSDLFEKSTVQRWLTQWIAFAQEMAAAPERSLRELPLDSNAVTARARAEARLAAVWRQLLQREGSIGAHEDFFSLGGTSLLALRVISQVESDWGVKLPLRRFLESPTIAALASIVESATSGTGRSAACGGDDSDDDEVHVL